MVHMMWTWRGSIRRKTLARQEGPAISLASGKRLRNELERSTMLKMDLPTISMVIFNSYASLNLLII